MKCPKCQTDNPSDSKFCRECATPLPSSKDISVFPTETLKTPYLWGSHTYNRACIASLLGEKENAVSLLRGAISQGQSYWNLYTDIDLEPLRDYPPFKELIKPNG